MTRSGHPAIRSVVRSRRYNLPQAGYRSTWGPVCEPLMLAVVERRLLIEGNGRFPRHAVELALEFDLRVGDELAVREQVGTDHGERLGGDHHPLLTDAHPRRCCRLPSVGDDARHGGRGPNPDGRRIPTHVTRIG